MIFVGERINGGFKDIQRAIKQKDKSVIQRWAKIQSEAGADYIDVNIGAVSNKVEDFIWMIETVQEAVETLRMLTGEWSLAPQYLVRQ